MITASTLMNTTQYCGTREALIASGLATADQFPMQGRRRLAKYRGYEAGKAKNRGSGLEWCVRKQGNEFIVCYSHDYAGLELYKERDQVFRDYGVSR